MKPISIQEIIDATGGQLVTPLDESSVPSACAVSTDTRNLPEGALFIALRGDHFDGHNYVQSAIEQGAACIMVDTYDEDELLTATLSKREEKPSVILVDDTLIGLQKLAYWYRRQLNIEVVAITGSNGKTSVKDFTASVVSQRFKINATKGNYNNHIGLPLSVLATEEDDEVCIFEMGMNHAGEIAPLCEIAAPNIGVITNIGTAHIEFFGSREAIAEEKSALGRSLSPQGTLVVPAVCDFVDYLIEHTEAHVIVAGNGRGVVRAEQLKVTKSGTAFQLCIDGQDSVPVEISVSGKHMVNNAILAAAVGHALDMSPDEIARGLSETVLTSGRLRRFECCGINVIDDTYNANPDSVTAAIETLSGLPVSDGARRIVVLGQMAELGSHADAEHWRIGQLAASKGIQLVCVGEGVEKIAEGARETLNKMEVSAEEEQVVKEFKHREDAAEWLKSYCSKGDIVLFKGSRMAKMEDVMNQVFPSSLNQPTTHRG